MGSCNAKNKERQNTPLSVSSIFHVNTAPDNNGNKTQREGISMKSNFYFFTDWILSYRFYIKLYNDEQNTKLITMLNGPNDKNIFKIIKAIDQIDEKDLSDFTNSLSLQRKSELSKQTKQQSFTVSKQLTNNSSGGLNGLTRQLSDEELKLTVLHLFERLNETKPKKMKKLIFQGPPNNLRWLMWISVAKTKYMDIENKIGVNNEQIFKYLINSPFTDEETETQIKKDLFRTKIDLKYFRGGNWTISLSNLLKAVALYDDKLGYCIGMNEIAASALIVSDCNEIECFNLLRFLYSNEYGLKLREFYINGFRQLKFYCFLIYELIKERMPKIYKVLNDNTIVSEMWLQKWIQNLYSNLLDFSVGVRLWDCIIALGIDFLINFSLGYVKYFEEQIIKCKDSIEFLDLFKEKKKFKNQKEVIEFREKLIKLSFDFHISPQTYERIQKKYNTFYERERRTSIMRSTIKYLHSSNRGELTLMKMDRTINGYLTNEETDKMKKIMNIIVHPNNQRCSVNNSITKAQIENKPFLTETNQRENSLENISDKSVVSNNSDNPKSNYNNIKKEIKERLITQKDKRQEQQDNDDNSDSGINKLNLNNIVIQTNNKQDNLQEHESNSDDEIIDNVDDSNIDEQNNTDDIIITNYSNEDSLMYLKNENKISTNEQSYLQSELKLPQFILNSKEHNKNM